MERHALYANTPEGVTFRVGNPAVWDVAIARWYRLDDLRRLGRAIRIRHARRWYRVESFEVRAVDRHGRGIGSDRHARAIPVVYGSVRLTPANPANPLTRAPLARRLAA